MDFHLIFISGTACEKEIAIAPGTFYSSREAAFFVELVLDRLV